VLRLRFLLFGLATTTAATTTEWRKPPSGRGESVARSQGYSGLFFSPRSFPRHSDMKRFRGWSDEAAGGLINKAARIAFRYLFYAKPRHPRAETPLH